MPVASAPIAPQLVEPLVELVPAAEGVVGPPRERRRLEHRERGGDRLLAHGPDRGGHRPIGTDDGRGRRQQLGDVAGGLAVAGRCWTRSRSPRCAGRSRRPARAWRRACRGRPGPRAACGPGSSVRSSSSSLTAPASSSYSSRPRQLFDDEQRERAVRARDHHPGGVDARVACQQREVRLVLHLRAAGRYEGRRRVAVRDVAPRPREQLRVGLVAPEGDDHGSGGRPASATNTARPTGCSPVARTSVASTPSAASASRRPAAPTAARPACRTRTRPRGRRPTRARWRRSGRWGSRATGRGSASASSGHEPLAHAARRAGRGAATPPAPSRPPPRAAPSGSGARR